MIWVHGDFSPNWDKKNHQKHEIKEKGLCMLLISYLSMLNKPTQGLFNFLE